MPGWFDVKSFTNIHGQEDEDGILKSINLVHRLITEEVDAGIPSDKIIVGGFSQGILLRMQPVTIGCSVALLAGYTCERKLAGVAGLSGWLPLLSKFMAVRNTLRRTNIDASRCQFENSFISSARGGRSRGEIRAWEEDA